MKKSMRKTWFWLSIGLSLGVIFSLANREWLDEFILKPLFYDWLLLKIYLESIPGLFLWIVFLILASGALAVVLLNLVKQKIRFESFKLGYPKEPLRDLAEKIRLARRGNFFRRSLNRELGETVVALIMAREHVDVREARRRFNAGIWTDNPEIKKLLELDSTLPVEGRLERLFGRWVLSQVSSLDQAEIEKIVAYLEDFEPGGNRAIG